MGLVRPSAGPFVNRAESSLQVLLEIHPFMQDAHNVDAVIEDAMKDEMRAGQVLAIAWAKLATCTPEERLAG